MTLGGNMLGLKMIDRIADSIIGAFVVPIVLLIVIGIALGGRP